MVNQLSFTVVTGYLRGEHTCPYELHATGCRDLRKLQRTQPNYEVLAPTPEIAVGVAIDDAEGTTKRSDYWVQPCCSLVRMKAIDRAPADFDPKVAIANLRASRLMLEGMSNAPVIVLTDLPVPIESNEPLIVLA